LVIVTEPVFLKWLRKKSLIIAIFISIVGGLYNQIWGDSEAITQAKQYCWQNSQIQVITGTIKSVSLRKITQYNGSGNYPAYKEYKFDIHGQTGNAVVLLRVEYKDGFNGKPSKFTVIDIFK
jgi:hypothetical protein